MTKQELNDKHKEFLSNSRKEDCRRNPFCLFGFEIGDGWCSIIEDFLTKVKLYCDNNKKEYPVIFQIKEKVGSLRIYMEAMEEEMFDYVEDLIDKAEAKSVKTCDNCGKEGKPVKYNDWIYNLCKDCFNDLKENK
jgi:hypothetical protein